MNAQNYSILILSCDSYSDVWPYLTQTFDRFWADCPFEIYLCSEQKTFSHPKIKNIKIGRKAGWSEMMLAVLEQVKTPNIIYMQEDYLLKSKIDNQLIYSILKISEENKTAYFRLFPWPNPDLNFQDRSDIGALGLQSAFRTSLQCAVWDVQIFRSLLRKEESGWDFEANSIARTKNIDRPFLSLKAAVDYATMNAGTYPIDYFATGVLHGKWMREAIFYFDTVGIKISPGKRGVLTAWDYWYRAKCKTSHFKQKGTYQLINKIMQSSCVILMHNWYIQLRGLIN
jgi:hypothetical protein